MLRLSRYVHLNPVFTAAIRQQPLAERISLLRRYPWSSYRAYIGRVRAPAFLDMGPVLAMTVSDAGTAAETYRGFVESGIEDVEAAFLEIKDLPGLCLGSPAFRAKIQTLYQDLLPGHQRAGEIAFRRRSTWRSVEEILRVVCRHLGVDRVALQRRSKDSFDRAIASRVLCDYGGLTQQQIADVLGIGSGGAVGRQLQKLNAEITRNARLKRQIAAIAADCQPEPPNA